MESGERLPRLETLIKLVGALGVTCDALLDGITWEPVVSTPGRFRVADGPPEVCVRRAMAKGRIGPPKSRHGRREVRLTEALARDVRARLAGDPGRDSTALFFTNEAGGPIDPATSARVLKPLVEEAGAPWAGFHAFRHTFASIHLAEGTNLVSLSRAMGHHSAAFTLSRYTHLLPG